MLAGTLLRLWESTLWNQGTDAPTSAMAASTSMPPPAGGQVDDASEVVPVAAAVRIINVAMATDLEEPFGLIALVNSTTSNCARPSDLRFHIVVPAGLRRRLRQLLESFFPQPSFRMVTLDVGGARAKILRHLRRRERDAVFVSPYRYAIAYLPILLPSVRRLLWVHTDVVVLDDVQRLMDVPLHGAPAAAVQDCSRLAGWRIDASRHPGVGSALQVGECDFDSSVMVVDLVQWALLDMTSRVEYWMTLNLRAAYFYAHDDSHAPLLLALLPVYAHLPPAWAVRGLGERRPSKSEQDKDDRLLSSLVGTATPLPDAGRRLVVVGVSNKNGSVTPAKAVHFSGRWKPWLRGSHASGPLCMHVAPLRDADGADDGAGNGGAGSVGVSMPCADLWVPYARRAVHMLEWRLPSVDEALHAAADATAAAVNGGKEAEQLSGTPRLEGDPSFSAAGDAEDGTLVHVTVVCGDSAPYGVAALVNSTLTHASGGTRAALRFHVVTRPELRDALSYKLHGALPGADGLIAVSAMSDERLAKLAARLTPIGVTTDPFEMPLLWVHHALPADVPRTVLLSSDTLVLFDVRELYSAALNGKVGAVIEDCSVLFENVFNYHHPLFASKHARSSCSFDAGTMLIDLKAWRKDEVPMRLIDVLGTQRRTEGLHQLPSAASSLASAALLALDKRTLKLPPPWLARGLAREAFTYDELLYWERLWGQQGVRDPPSLRPFRAAHAVAKPSREIGDALMLRFSGGQFSPWLRRCTPASAASAPVCGKSLQVDCARLWRPYFSPSLVPLMEAEFDESGALQLVRSAQRPCVAEARVTATGATATGAIGASTPAAFDADADAATEMAEAKPTPMSGAAARSVDERTTGRRARRPAMRGAADRGAAKGTGAGAVTEDRTSSSKSRRKAG